MVLREGEGEASTPRLQRAEAKRAAQNNLKRKLEKLAARRHCGTFLAPTKVQKRSIVESESEVEQGRDVAERAVFKTPPRSASAIAADGEAARPQAEGPEATKGGRASPSCAWKRRTASAPTSARMSPAP